MSYKKEKTAAEQRQEDEFKAQCQEAEIALSSPSVEGEEEKKEASVPPSEEKGLSSEAQTPLGQGAPPSAPPPREPTPLEKAEAERDAYLQLAKRIQADFENYRKRIQREQALWKREALALFLSEFLSAFDDFDRILEEGKKDPKSESFYTGVALVRGNLWKPLEKVGVQKISPKGEKFNPKFHEAIATVPASDREPGTILEIYQDGYVLDDYVLRPAKVILAGPPGESEPRIETTAASLS